MVTRIEYTVEITRRKISTAMMTARIMIIVSSEVTGVFDDATGGSIGKVIVHYK